MSFLLLENKNYNGGANFIEMFGLSQSGKTTLLKKLAREKHYGKMRIRSGKFSKFIQFIKHLIKNPIKTSYLFYKLNTSWILSTKVRVFDYSKIFLMKNSYLIGVLSKYETLLKMKRKVIVDEFSLLSLFMIFHRKSSENEIRSAMKKLPKSDKVLLVEINQTERYKILNRIRFPGEQYSKPYSRLWMKNSEYNYKIIKKILLKDFEIISNDFLFR